MTRIARGPLAGISGTLGALGVLSLLAAGTASAQESKSAALAKELATKLGAAKLTSIANRDASQPDVYVAAMYFPGTLLVVSAKFPVPAALDDKLLKKDYQDVYADLQAGAGTVNKVFVQDIGADGLKYKTSDSVDAGSGSMTFDGDWKKAKAASQQEYQKAFANRDEQYVRMLTALLARVDSDR